LFALEKLLRTDCYLKSLFLYEKVSPLRKLESSLLREKDRGIEPS